MQTEVIPLELHRLHGSVLKTLFLFFYSTKKKKKTKAEISYQGNCLDCLNTGYGSDISVCSFCFPDSTSYSNPGEGYYSFQYCDTCKYFGSLQGNDHDPVSLSQMHHMSKQSKPCNSIFYVNVIFYVWVQTLYKGSAITNTETAFYMVQTNVPCDAFEIDSRHASNHFKLPSVFQPWSSLAKDTYQTVH